MSKVLSISAFNFTSMETKHHRGNRLERALRAEGVNFVELATKIKWKGKHGINRMTLYNWFKDENLGIDKVMAVAKHVPSIAEVFTELDVKQQLMDDEVNYMKQEGVLTIECQKQINYWRGETIALQRRVMELQETIINLKSAS